MKKIKIIALAVVAIATTIGIHSCKTLKDNKDNITSAQDFASSESEFSGAFDVSDDINQSDAKIKKGGSTILPSGAILTFQDSLFSDMDGIEYSLDFGPLGASVPKGILCGDGKYRSGVLHISITKRYSEIGCSVIVMAEDADNYYSGDGTNMFKVQGSLAVTRTAAEEVSVVVTGGKVTDGDGKTAEFQGTKNIKRTKGSGTPGILGDEYEVTGSGSGKNREGDSYTWNITKALLKRIETGCAKTFIIGIIEIQNTTAKTSLKIDFDPYNTGGCDRIAKATIGGKDYIFTVR